ncbi:uncharacterized protein LOC133035540 [Cannabis sativa]|uniref:uncharacterized protein LOC133035540 n=1 Tax=Cannabis sativa TaxID=3483 RepID=UPI0029C9DE5F|nr:uncharacterized protein LOC133035540 [Cannabis sativa]
MEVPLSDNINVDSWFWGKESNGFYSVKSSYHYLQELKGEWGVQLESNLWKVLWKVKVPPRSGVGLHFCAESTFADWFKAFLSGGRVALVDELLMVAWGIWKARNELLWQGRSSQAADVVRVARSCHSSWLLA